MFSGNVWDNWWGGGYIGVSVGWVIGSFWLGNDVDCFVDVVSVCICGYFDKWIWCVECIQSLGGVSNWGLYLGVNGQIGSKNLDLFEKFLFGGLFGVCGYLVGEVSGDSGWFVSVELWYDILLIVGLSVQVLVFVDCGYVCQYVDLWVGLVMLWMGN